jgi:hypothetical protein
MEETLSKNILEHNPTTPDHLFAIVLQRSRSIGHSLTPY